MKQEEILRKIFYYTEEQIYDCDVAMRVADHSDISITRYREGGKWRIYERAQKYEDLGDLKSKLISWKKKAAEQRESLPKNFRGTMIERQNADAEQEGKIWACDELLEYISKLENE